MSAVALLLSTSCQSQELTTVAELDLERYMGTWYEVARLPNSFEKGLECITATYKLQPNGKVAVINRGKKANGAVSQVQGVAWVPDKSEPGKLKVRFFWPFAGKYWIVHIDANYRFALVGEPKRKYFWILSRTPELDKDTLQELTRIAEQKGFDANKLIYVNQKCP